MKTYFTTNKASKDFLYSLKYSKQGKIKESEPTILNMIITVMALTS